MKRNSLFFIVIITSVCFLQVVCCVQQAVAAEKSEPRLETSEPKTDSAKSEAPPVLTKGGPKLTFKNVVHDFGNIGPGSENVCEFEFTNTGDELLKIARIKKTCGCTPYELTKKRYQPGESGTLKVKYNASSRPDSVRKALIVYSNDKANSEVRLVIKAKIVPKISCLPKSIDFVLNKENGGCSEITIKSLDGKPFSIKGFDVKWQSRSAKGGITADYDPSAEAVEFVLQPKVDMNELQKGTRGYIEIALTHPESDVVAVPFSLLPRFKTTPQSLIVYKAKPGEPVAKEVWVLSNYDDDFEVESTSTKNGTVKVLSQEKIGNRYKFKLEVTPPDIEKGKKKFFTDEFLINIKSGEKLKVACRLFYS